MHGTGRTIVWSTPVNEQANTKYWLIGVFDANYVFLHICDQNYDEDIN